MNRPWLTSLILAVSLAVVLAAMGWISVSAFRLDQAQQQARQEATFEGSIRLSLWRMDSALAPLIAQESARPYFTYSAFYPAEGAYNRMFEEIQRGEVMFPSPLLGQTLPYVLLHFQIEPDGAFTSPQVPTGLMRTNAEKGFTSSDQIETAAVRLERLAGMTSRADLLAAAGPPPATQPVRVTVRPGGQSFQPAYPVTVSPDQQQFTQSDQPSAQPPQPRQGQFATQGAGQFDLQQRVERQFRQIEIQQSGQAQKGLPTQTMMNTAEWNARNDNLDINGMVFLGPGNNYTGLAMAKVSEGLVRAVWLGEQLLLIRAVSANRDIYVQGVWLDWPAIHSWLINEVKDLLPEGQLKPVTGAVTDNDGGRMLAALPVRLIPGPVPTPPAVSWSPIRFSLLIAWICVILAAIAVVGLLVGIIALSERRAAFVSAVTHEMRTPLTTFRMYTEMLNRNMVTDEAKRKRYLDTLGAEANRLSHLVENVLAYARLERHRAASRTETITLADLIGRIRNRLNERAERSSMDLVVDLCDRSPATRLRIDTAAVEQILSNLVDNACKYANDAEDRRIHVETMCDNGDALVRVRDHGPGISKDNTRRLFQPFCKSARQAAHSAPGIGLGLALSRRLARQLGGDLRLAPNGDCGACFALTLPVTESN